MEICVWKGQDIHRTRALYEEVFGDTKEYTDYFYHRAEAECTAIVMLCGEEVVGETFLVPKEIRIGSQRRKVYYIYGVATAGAYRGRGIMKALLAQAEILAKQEDVTLLYLIPVDAKIYEPLGYKLVKKGYVKNYELCGKESKTMLQSVSVLESFPYEALKKLEQEVYENVSVIPLRDESYIRERIRRAVAEGGDIRAFYENVTKTLKGICITEQREGAPAVMDMICRNEDKEALIQCYLREEKQTSLKEYSFPVMMKSVDGKMNIPAAAKVYINDEI